MARILCGGAGWTGPARAILTPGGAAFASGGAATRGRQGFPGAAAAYFASNSGCWPRQPEIAR